MAGPCRMELACFIGFRTRGARSRLPHVSGRPHAIHRISGWTRGASRLAGDLRWQPDCVRIDPGLVPAPIRASEIRRSPALRVAIDCRCVTRICHVGRASQRRTEQGRAHCGSLLSPLLRRAHSSPPTLFFIVATLIRSSRIRLDIHHDHCPYLDWI